MKDKLALAIEQSNRLFAGVKDKSGQPYILHPLRIMMEFEDETHRIVAVLHDNVEDSKGKITVEDLRLIFGDVIAEAVDALSRRELAPLEDSFPGKVVPRENYMDFIRRCSLNKIARRVKLMDIKDNRRPERYNPNLVGLQGRYIKAQDFLVDALKDGDKDDIQFLYAKGLIQHDEFRALYDEA